MKPRFSLPNEQPLPARRLTARFAFIVGLLLMGFGTAFLIGSLAGISRLSVLVAFLFVILGCLFAILAIGLNKRDVYLFFATFFTLVGFFLFLAALGVFPVPLSKAWPLLSVFAGLALIPSGWRHYGGFKPRYVVPAIAFILLGCALLLFAFRMVPFSFAHFIRTWWPLLLGLAGLILILVSLGSRGIQPKAPSPPPSGDAADDDALDDGDPPANDPR